MSKIWTCMDFRHSITVWFPSSSVFRQFFQNVSEIQPFDSNFIYFCTQMSYIWTLLFGFQTPYASENQTYKSYDFAQFRFQTFTVLTNFQLLQIFIFYIFSTFTNLNFYKFYNLIISQFNSFDTTSK